MNEHAHERSNVTLSLPRPLLRRFRVYAAERNQSMTALMTEAIHVMLRRDGKNDASRRFMELMRKGADLGTGGKITWTRDEIHERGVR